MIATSLSIAGSAASLYGLISGVKTGHQIEEALSRLKDIDSKIEKISENILIYESSIVRDIKKQKQPYIRSKKDVIDKLASIQKLVGGNVLSSDILVTPEKMQNAMKSNPWHVLDNIRPWEHAIAQSNPDMVPIHFEQQGVHYIGWQLRGAIPMLFDCDYRPELWNARNIQTLYSKDEVSSNDNKNRNDVIEGGNRNQLLVNDETNISAVDESLLTSNNSVSITQYTDVKTQSTVNASNYYKIKKGFVVILFAVGVWAVYLYNNSNFQLEDHDQITLNSLKKDVNRYFSDMTNIFVNITDAESATYSIPRLEEQSSRLNAIKLRTGYLSEDERRELSKYVTNRTENMNNYVDKVMGIPGVDEILNPVVFHTNELLNKIGY